jgi:hypothetical protein
VRAMKLNTGEAYELVRLLLDGPERAAVLADLVADPGWRRSGQLFAQTEVLQPNSTLGYTRNYARARYARDEAAAAAVIERLKRAPKLDTSEVVGRRADYVAGKTDATVLADLDALLARYETVSALTGLSSKTLAAIESLWATSLGRKGTMTGDAATFEAAMAHMERATKLWPALNADGNAHALVDRIGLAADKDRWRTLRRERGTASLLYKLSADNDPIVATIKADPRWAQVAPLLRALVGVASLGDLELARLTGDAAAIARTSSVLDDKLARLDLELDQITDPGQASTAEDRAVLDKR